jgi:hypothetical protein
MKVGSKAFIVEFLLGQKKKKKEGIRQQGTIRLPV